MPIPFRSSDPKKKADEWDHDAVEWDGVEFPDDMHDDRIDRLFNQFLDSPAGKYARWYVDKRRKAA
jgi:hypothetical protein